MSSATVFLFLLDNLPGFHNALNSTLVTLCENEALSFDISSVEECNPIVAQSVLKDIQNDIESENPTDQHNKENVTHIEQPTKYNQAYYDFSSDALYNIGTVFDNTVEDSDAISIETTKDASTESKPIKYLNSRLQVYKNDNVINVDDESIHGNINKSSVFKFPENAPFVAVIFETLSNVTAQTCGGTVLSPHWVLTAASCVDLLPNLYRNSTKQKRSEYTIVVGAKNPLIDGTVHNVTDLLLFPNTTLNTGKLNTSIVQDTNKTKVLEIRNASLALMRIEPAAKVEVLQIVRNHATGVEDIQVYGWILVKNDTGGEFLNAASFPAKTLPSQECRTNDSFLEPDSILCLTPQGAVEDTVNQMSSGGPVLVLQNEKVLLLGVAEFEQPAPQSPYIASSLAAYAAWIDDIIANK